MSRRERRAATLAALTPPETTSVPPRRRRRDWLFWVAMAWLLLVVGCATFAPLLPLGEHSDAAKALTEPIYAPIDLFSEHPLGTNNYGLDMLSRVVYGARTSLLIALTAVIIGTALGCVIGLVAGFLGKATDSVIGVFTNALLSVPPLVLLIALGTVLDPTTRNIAFALSLLTIPSMIRLARATTITYSRREFVTAARAMGAKRSRLMWRELLPNVVMPVLSLAVVMVSMLIVAEASLSFLGLGIRPPDPTWGNMIAEGQNGVMEDHPAVVLIPGVCLFATVFALNLLGERAQTVWDPRAAKL